MQLPVAQKLQDYEIFMDAKLNNFDAFSPDSFEQFTRALSIKILGPGVTAFGNGPDGGREATFNGRLSFPHPPSDMWAGYGVLQAKFKEKTETTQKDQAWAEKQLKAELKGWATSKLRKPKPDYFIFVTNVALTSAPNGGREKLDAVFKSYQLKLAFKGWSIWDANQLTAYVNSEEEIRKRFLQFFTTGDLLAEFAKQLKNTPNAESILANFLAREILADEDARLSQAGDRSEDRIRLADVFVDLPIGNALHDDVIYPEIPTALENLRQKQQRGSVAKLLHASGHKLDPIALIENKQQSQRNGVGDPDVNIVHGRFVFLGGPGSGKSTIGQFLAQINRAALLARRPVHRVEEKVLNVVDRIKNRCKEDSFVWPKIPRYPFRVELNAFAKQLSAKENEGVKSLSEYLRRRLSSDVEISHADLRKWLSIYPWLLILDGLDEVPTSSNRSAVVAAIHAFLSEARDVEADLMIVASSRPDGYANEFDGDEVEQAYLLPLSKGRALSCAQRYVTAKMGSEKDPRAIQAMSTLSAAVENPLIARLMLSPLQVTFMVTVVAASGKPSESRWQLFSDYYRTIYDRELHKAVPPFGQVLNDRRPDIDTLHQRVGLVLQCRSENSGGTQSDLSLDEFESLVDKCLEENGLSDEDKKKQRDMIMGAANQRLVFLTSRTPNRLSFDVRSLQEYMAAAALTSADSDVIIDRLEKVAHSVFWRNTLLFAIGRFFVDSQLRVHRDKIRLLCENLNLRNGIDADLLLGSRIALAILESGAPANIPLVQRSLVDCALKLLSIPTGRSLDLTFGLAELYDPSMKDAFVREISIHIGQSNASASLSAWILLLRLEQKAVSWAAEFANMEWPDDVSKQTKILQLWFRHVSRPHTLESDINYIRANAVMRFSPLEISSSIIYDGNPNGTILELNQDAATKWPALFVLNTWLNQVPDRRISILFNGKDTGLKTVIDNLFPEYNENYHSALSKAEFSGGKKGIEGFFSVLALLIMEKKRENLANVLHWVADNVPVESWSIYGVGAGWLVLSCLNAANKSSSLLYKIIEEIKLSDNFNYMQLLEKLQKWEDSGIELYEASIPLFAGGPSVLQGTSRWSVENSKNEDALQVSKLVVDELLQFIESYSEKPIPINLIEVTKFYLSCRVNLSKFDPERLKQDLLVSGEVHTATELIPPKNIPKSSVAGWYNFFDVLGRHENIYIPENPWHITPEAMIFAIEGFEDDISRVGLVRIAAYWCSMGVPITEHISKKFSFENFEIPEYQFCALILNISAPGLTIDRAALIGKCLAPLVNDENVDILFRVIKNQRITNDNLVVILKIVTEHFRGKRNDLSIGKHLLREALVDSLPSGYSDHGLTLL